MAKWWALLFGVVMAACFGLFLVSPALGWWLPPGVSSISDLVDGLFYFILYITGFFFVLTEALLVWFMFKYGTGQKPPQSKPPEFVTRLIPNQHRLEIYWTIVPAIILLIVAFTQVGTWANAKYRSRMPKLEATAQPAPPPAAKADPKVTPMQIEVSARQFEWRMRYPSSKRLEEWLSKKDEATAKDFASFAEDRRGKDGQLRQYKQISDVRVVNELHVVVNRPVLVQLKTLDVIHSFNLPHLRVKQDALPGQTIPVWFTPTKVNTRKIKLPAREKNLKKINVEKKVLTIMVDGKDEELLVTEKTKFKNEFGEELIKGIKAAELKEAEFVHFWKNKDNNVLDEVQLPDLSRWEDRFNSDSGKPNDKKFQWDLACAELCGWGHYRMIGRIYVHESQTDLLHWLKHVERRQNLRTPTETGKAPSK